MRTYGEYPLPAIGVIVWDGSKVLLVQRGKEPNYGQWNIPGGAIERGETVEAAARREIEEECGIKIDQPELLTYVDILDYDAEQTLRYHYIVLEMVANLVEGEAEAADDALAVGWFTVEDLEELDLWERTREVLELAWRYRQTKRVE